MSSYLPRLRCGAASGAILGLAVIVILVLLGAPLVAS